MTGFGKRLDGPGGRRRSERKPILLNAAMIGMRNSCTVTLLDVSSTGAQMKMPEPMRCGQEIWLKVPPADIFGRVVWIEGEHCGIHFDEPIAAAELASLQAQGKVVMLHGMSEDELLAAEEWRSGRAR